MDVFTVLGIIGMILILVAFIMGQTGKWKDSDLLYDMVNFIGSTLLVVYAIAGWAIPFIILNVIWAGYSLHDIIVDLRREYGKKHHILKSKRMLK